MKLVWSPDTASKAFIDTVKSCENFEEFGVAELLSAMAAGWNAKLILHACSPTASSAVTTIGLAVAARHTGGRYVCAVADERSKSVYVKNLQEAGVSSPKEIIVGEAEMATVAVVGVDFLVVDCKRKDFTRVLRLVKVSEKGAILICRNTWPRSFEKLGYCRLLPKGTRFVRSVSLPVGQGLSIIHIGSSHGGNGDALISTSKPSRWMKHVDERSGEEHVYRERI
ncbi:uncharacterized protein LOC103499021 [Cucumis melo]|uniref:Uncharacterized protein LOC103499021 n=1 Tax=Cucumis melo TaxID=3656 RepID=A0A1S3CBT0_CUCME|nr:uncharacterized protein LOC103499021 [Cucumis melo]